LPRISLEAGGLTVSGISSGGYMAQQFHVIHSREVDGAAIFAAGPYRCAGGGYPWNLWRTTAVCMDFDDWVPFRGPPDAADSVSATEDEAGAGTIDPVAGLTGDRVYLFSGTNDATVPPSIVDTLRDYYGHFLDPADLLLVADRPAGHAMITEDFGGACQVTGPPFINDCDYDAAGALLAHLYGALEPARPARSEGLVAFDQRAFFPEGERASLADTGYAYVPEACSDGGSCRLHVAFHGCEQYASQVGDAFYAHAGYNPWAEGNRIVVLYPQTRPTVSFFGRWPNPKGCWDWWGYTGPDYHRRTGPQIRAVKAMLDQLSGGD
jgi:poly(3-hydroxybutyrate) depolymerase